MYHQFFWAYLLVAMLKMSNEKNFGPLPSIFLDKIGIVLLFHTGYDKRC